MDNRKLVNSELKNTFDGGLVSLANDHSSNFVELPNQEQTESQETGNVVNNFSVNVNVNSKGSNSVNIDRSKATNIVNNVLGNNTPTTPDEIKKNSNEVSKPVGDNNIMVLENEKSAIQLINQTENQGPEQPSLDIREIDYSPNDPTDYSYSESPVKSKNMSLKREYDILHSLTSNGLTDHHNMSPIADGMIVNEFNENMKEVNFNYYNSSNVAVDNKQQKPYDKMSEISERNDKRIQMREQERDTALSEMARNQTKRKDNELEYSEIKDGRDLSGGMISGAKVLNTSGVRNFNNMSSRSSTIPLFIDKMNSPPIWRTGLG